MLAAFRLAGLSALGAHYADLNALAISPCGKADRRSGELSTFEAELLSMQAGRSGTSPIRFFCRQRLRFRSGGARSASAASPA
jgi:hypothetical protein